MRKIVIISFAAALLATAPAAQAASSDTNTNRSESAARDQSQASGGSRSPERQICVREARSGSHLRPQVCHTAREWRDLQGNDSDNG